MPRSDRSRATDCHASQTFSDREQLSQSDNNFFTQLKLVEKHGRQRNKIRNNYSTIREKKPAKMDESF